MKAAPELPLGRSRQQPRMGHHYDVEPEDLPVSPLESHYRRVALVWIVIAVVVVIATVIVILYLSGTWPFHPSPEPNV